MKPRVPANLRSIIPGISCTLRGQTTRVGRRWRDCALMRTVWNKRKESEGKEGKEEEEEEEEEERKMRGMFIMILRSRLYPRARSASFAAPLPPPPSPPHPARSTVSAGSPIPPCDLVFPHWFLANKPAAMSCLPCLPSPPLSPSPSLSPSLSLPFSFPRSLITSSERAGERGPLLRGLSGSSSSENKKR